MAPAGTGAEAHLAPCFPGFLAKKQQGRVVLGDVTQQQAERQLDASLLPAVGTLGSARTAPALAAPLPPPPSCRQQASSNTHSAAAARLRSMR